MRELIKIINSKVPTEKNKNSRGILLKLSLNTGLNLYLYSPLKLIKTCCLTIPYLSAQILTSNILQGQKV